MKMLTGAASRPATGGRYLLSLQLEREWRETRLIMEGEAPTPPLYTRARIVPLHEVESVVTQTMPPPATETGMMTRDLEIAHTKNLVMARIGALTQGAGIEVWVLQNFIRSLGANRYARGSAPYRVYKCIRPLPRAYPLLDRAFGESPHRRNRGRVCCLCGIVNDPCSASWFVCFPVPIWGREKPLQKHYYALRTTICVCAIPASTAYADCTTGAYPKLGSSGSTSYYACNATTGARTKIYGSTDTTADGGGAFTGSGKVSFSILAFEFANEVVLRKGFGCATGVHDICLCCIRK